jgi:hypothetical protein
MPASLKLCSANSSVFFSHSAARSRPGTSSQFAAPQADTLCATSDRLAQVFSARLLRRSSCSSRLEERYTVWCAVTRPRFVPPSAPLSSASLSSSSEAPATSSGSHSTSELSSRGHLQPLWHRRAALSARHDCGSRRRKLCLLAHRSLPLACFTPAELRNTLRKGPSLFGPFLKASMVGFTLLSRSYYYLRRRSPGPGPVPARPPSGRGTGG